MIAYVKESFEIVNWIAFVVKRVEEQVPLVLSVDLLVNEAIEVGGDDVREKLQKVGVWSYDSSFKL